MILKGDLILKFGDITLTGTCEEAIQATGRLVQASENVRLSPGGLSLRTHSHFQVSIPVIVKRGDDSYVELNLVPSRWGGRGLLGCQIIPV